MGDPHLGQLGVIPYWVWVTLGDANADQLGVIPICVIMGLS